MVDVKVSAFGTPVPIGSLAALLRGDQKDKDGRPTGRGAAADEFERWGAFVNGNVEIGRYDGRGGTQGSELRSRGITAGFDYRFNDNAIGGASVGFLKGDTDLLGNGNQDSKGYSLSLYGTLTPMEKSYVDFTLNVGRNDYDTRRNVFNDTGTLLGTASSSADGSQLALAGSFGLDVVTGSLRLNPYGRLEYIRAKINGFEERGSTQDIRVDSQLVKSASFTLGAQANYAISTTWGVILPQARVEWSWATRDVRSGVFARLVSNPGAQSELTAASEDNSYGNAAVGVTFQFPRGVSCFINYEQLFAKDLVKTRRWDFGVRIAF